MEVSFLQSLPTAKCSVHAPSAISTRGSTSGRRPSVRIRPVLSHAPSPERLSTRQQTTSVQVRRPSDRLGRQLRLLPRSQQPVSTIRPMDEQAARITELQARNQALEDENTNLRERMYILQRELANAHQHASDPMDESSDEDAASGLDRLHHAQPDISSA
ncbi:hypothetical protein WJX72_001920 [[Myrmecia] bisecta]|uniref:Uncharacterized protein n=1 Tax=[Myrmecia] bisecta TaxID=41462 RepID=A0AAW1QBJ1_9CHLO